ncbi:chemotaxis protein [Aliihoeflea sp. 40Bstr573]|uniref:chemotaxis protein n=1 Tax=Aliihoeflea sp. 40Bstr573 TaxID=2696467 RepID=UPI0020942D8E|nr:chemotaxis protein [Aliihoeflea sp. 40Bstr573]MCO6386597.1 chemotaxis protein [Aliihoeflea sp. 40Bstr573]
MRRAAARLGLSLAICGALAGAAAASSALQPFQMIRSLQLVQDRIANGDHAALPMQRKLLEMIDERMRNATPEDFAEPRNFSALLIYAMSGGNPVTLDVALSRLDPASPAKPLADALRAYLGGNFKDAGDALAAIDPVALGDHAPFVALVKGTVLSNEKPDAALENLDVARLLAPGTLVEEAALRRSLLVAVSASKPDVFTRVSSAYVRRFLRSPYASQFAEAFVSGLAAMHASLDAAQMAETLTWMTPEQAETIALRVSRQAAIANDPAMIAFAERLAAGEPATDPRALLYSSIGGVASPKVADTLSTLQSIDRSRLSEGDRALLDAATDIARTVVDRPEAVPASAGPVATGLDATSDTESYISSTRAKLDAIDSLLEGSN